MSKNFVEKATAEVRHSAELLAQKEVLLVLAALLILILLAGIFA